MAPLPRATCARCGRDVPVRVNGRLREHTSRPGAGEPPLCPGSGQVPAPAEQTADPEVRALAEHYLAGDDEADLTLAQRAARRLSLAAAIQRAIERWMDTERT